MVGITFARNIGPCADTKELEYVSSLHQTGKKSIRQDGTINARDVRYFLCSRHGIQIEENMVSRAIIQELAGTIPIIKSEDQKEEPLAVIGSGSGDSDKDKNKNKKRKKNNKDDDNDDDEEEDNDDEEEPRMDLCQVLALLLIPFLRGGNSDGDQLETVRVGKVIEIALNSIWAELRVHSIDIPDDEKEEGVLVTTDFLRQIMDMYGEFALPEEILQEMISQASGDKNNQSQFYMTKASFLQAMTADIQLWDPNFDLVKSTHFDNARLTREAQLLKGTTKDNIGSSHYEDAVEDPVEDPIPRKDKEGKTDDEDESSSNSAYPFTQLYTASNIDSYADTYRSTFWFVLVWGSTVWIYVAYITNFKHKTEKLDGCDNKFGCAIAVSIINWMNIAIGLMFYGFIWFMMANLGNSTHPTDTIKEKLRTTFRMFWGMLLVFVVCVLSYFTEYTTDIYDTNKEDEKRGAYVIVLMLGLGILLFQFSRLLSMYVSLGPFTKGSQEDKERRTKLSASAKTCKFVEHATLLHVSPDDDATVASSLTKSVSSSVAELTRKLHNSNSIVKKSGSASNKEKGTSSSKVLLNYSRMQDYEEESGGIIWTWKSLWDGSLLNEEGIYLHGRLLAVNMVQFLICFFLIGYVVSLQRMFEDFIEPGDDGCTFRVDGIFVSSDGHTNLAQGADNLGNALDSLLDGFNSTDDDEFGSGPTFWDANSTWDEAAELWNATGDPGGFLNSTLDAVFNLNTTHFGDVFGNLYKGQVPVWNGTAFSNGALTVCYDYYITNGTDVWENEVALENSLKETLNLQHWEYTTAFALGLLASIFSSLSISFLFIPSFVSSVLKYRSGFMPSLKGNKMTYLMYRSSPDQTAIIWGASLWGILASSALVFVLVGGVVFLLVWEVTRQFLGGVLAQFIGIAATISIKVVIMMLLRNSFYAGGYYRRRPAASNIMNVVLESWNLGLSIGTVASRVVHLIVVTCFYIGRIDTPMLAPGVGNIAGANLDPSPDAFRKDILITEAHRHPFIERLGLLYLLKLYNGKDFGTRAGAYWRILFVLALFPWMRNYRVSTTIANLMTELEAENEELQKDDEAEDRKSLEGPPGGLGKLWDDSDSIETLAAKRRALKNQLRDLNMLLSLKLDDAGSTQCNEMNDNSIKRMKGVEA